MKTVAISSRVPSTGRSRPMRAGGGSALPTSGACMHHRTKRSTRHFHEQRAPKRFVALLFRGNPTMASATGTTRDRDERSRGGSLARPAGSHRGMFRWKRRQREMHHPQRDQKGDNGGTNKWYSSPATPSSLFGAPPAGAEPAHRAINLRDGPFGRISNSRMCGPGCCGRDNSPGSGGAGCLGIGYSPTSVLFCLFGHQNSRPHQFAWERSLRAGCAGRRMGQKKAPRKRGARYLLPEGVPPQRAHRLRPAPTLFGCTKATSPPKSRQDQPQSCWAMFTLCS